MHQSILIIILISVPDYDDDVITENVGRKKQTNQKLFERFYKPHGSDSDDDNFGDADDDTESDAVEDGMALV